MALLEASRIETFEVATLDQHFTVVAGPSKVQHRIGITPLLAFVSKFSEDLSSNFCCGDGGRGLLRISRRPPPLLPTPALLRPAPQPSELLPPALPQPSTPRPSPPAPHLPGLLLHALSPTPPAPLPLTPSPPTQSQPSAPTPQPSPSVQLRPSSPQRASQAAAAPQLSLPLPELQQPLPQPVPSPTAGEIVQADFVLPTVAADGGVPSGEAVAEHSGEIVNCSLPGGGGVQPAAVAGCGHAPSRRQGRYLIVVPPPG